ncbi:hypothetical protein [Nocardioides sp.]|uniref:hypothetical protein n=1 Tax=Nocardioides sp. TaxID=35761 RepID=UPI002B271838|nr:hypothetical protein [Nocardioides sp.]
MNETPQNPYGQPADPEEPSSTSPSWQPYGAPTPPPPPYGIQQPYGAPVPPYGVDPYGGPVSDKNKTTAGLLQLLLPLVGVCGVGRLYAGYTTVGLVQLIGFFVSFCLSAAFIGLPFLVGIWIWSIVDGILMLANPYRDSQGRLMRS